MEGISFKMIITQVNVHYLLFMCIITNYYEGAHG